MKDTESSTSNKVHRAVSVVAEDSCICPPADARRAILILDPGTILKSRRFRACPRSV